MAKVTPEDLAKSMSRRLANFKLSDEAIKGLAERVTIEGLEIGRFDPCIYGICIDYHTTKLPRFTADHGVSKWEVFPYGILEWDRFRVRVAFDVPELEGKAIARGFQN
jgi:hypothetical protein